MACRPELESECAEATKTANGGPTTGQQCGKSSRAAVSRTTHRLGRAAAARPAHSLLY